MTLLRGRFSSSSTIAASIKPLIVTVVLLFLLPGTSTAESDSPVLLSSALVFDKYGDIHEKIKAKCQLESRIPKAIAERDSNVSLVERIPLDAEFVLEARIQTIRRQALGTRLVWTVAVTGQLLRDGEVIGDFTATRSPDKNMADRLGSTFEDTCGKFEIAIGRLADDIIGFLRSPRFNAELGV